MDESEFRYQDKTIHPRQAEILKNNYNLFIDRAAKAEKRNDVQDYLDNIKWAVDAAEQYEKITGKAPSCFRV